MSWYPSISSSSESNNFELDDYTLIFGYSSNQEQINNLQFNYYLNASYGLQNIYGLNSYENFKHSIYYGPLYRKIINGNYDNSFRDLPGFYPTGSQEINLKNIYVNCKLFNMYEQNNYIVDNFIIGNYCEEIYWYTNIRMNEDYYNNNKCINNIIIKSNTKLIQNNIINYGSYMSNYYFNTFRLPRHNLIIEDNVFISKRPLTGYDEVLNQSSWTFNRLNIIIGENCNIDFGEIYPNSYSIYFDTFLISNNTNINLNFYRKDNKCIGFYNFYIDNTVNGNLTMPYIGGIIGTKNIIIKSKDFNHQLNNFGYYYRRSYFQVDNLVLGSENLSRLFGTQSGSYVNLFGYINNIIFLPTVKNISFIYANYNNLFYSLESTRNLQIFIPNTITDFSKMFFNIQQPNLNIKLFIDKPEQYTDKNSSGVFCNMYHSNNNIIRYIYLNNQIGNLIYINNDSGYTYTKLFNGTETRIYLDEINNCYSDAGVNSALATNRIYLNYPTNINVYDYSYLKWENWTPELNT